MRREWRYDIGSSKALLYLPNLLSVRHPERSGEILLTVVLRRKQPPHSRTIFQSRKGEKWRTSGLPTSEGSLKRFDVKLMRIFSNIHLKGYIKPHYRSRKPSWRLSVLDRLVSLPHQNFDSLLRFAPCRVCFANIEFRMTDRGVVLAEMIAAKQHKTCFPLFSLTHKAQREKYPVKNAVKPQHIVRYILTEHKICGMI